MNALKTIPGMILTAVAVGLLCIVLGMTAHRLGFRFDPFDRQAEKIASAERRADRAESDSAARAVEAEAAVATTRSVEQAAGVLREVQAATITYTINARADPDALFDLDPDRRERLRAHDRRLCELAPDVCASDAAATGPAGAVPDALQPAGPAG